jgi:hypothetical protein
MANSVVANGGLASAPGGAGAYLKVDLTNFAANGSAGSAVATVDNVTHLVFSQTTANITVQLATPTDPTKRRTITLEGGTSVQPISVTGAAAGSDTLVVPLIGVREIAWDAMAWRAVAAANLLPSNGRKSAITTHNGTLNTGSYTNVFDSAVPIPGPGRWRIVYKFFAAMTAIASKANGALFNSGGTMVPGSESSFSSGTATGLGPVAGEAIVDTSGAEVFNIRALATGGNCSFADSPNNGYQSSVTWEQISGNTPVTGQVVSSVYIAKTAADTQNISNIQTYNGTNTSSGFAVGAVVNPAVAGLINFAAVDAKLTKSNGLLASTNGISVSQAMTLDINATFALTFTTSSNTTDGVTTCAAINRAGVRTVCAVGGGARRSQNDITYTGYGTQHSTITGSVDVLPGDIIEFYWIATVGPAGLNLNGLSINVKQSGSTAISDIRAAQVAFPGNQMPMIDSGHLTAVAVVASGTATEFYEDAYVRMRMSATGHLEFMSKNVTRPAAFRVTGYNASVSSSFPVASTPASDVLFSAYGALTANTFVQFSGNANIGISSDYDDRAEYTVQISGLNLFYRVRQAGTSLGVMHIVERFSAVGVVVGAKVTLTV